VRKYCKYTKYYKYFLKKIFQRQFKITRSKIIYMLECDRNIFVRKINNRNSSDKNNKIHSTVARSSGCLLVILLSDSVIASSCVHNPVGKNFS